MDNNDLHQYAAQLEKCWNNDCHEGTMILLGHEINVFTKEPEYNDEGEEISYGGDKCAFVDEEYWTGWYEQDLGSDLEEVMTDVTKYVLNKQSVKFNISGTIEDELFEEYNIQEITSELKKSIEQNLSAMDYMIDEDSLEVHVCKKTKSFTASFTDKWWGCKAFFLGDYKEFSDESYDAEISCPDETVKEYFQQAFNYSISF